MPARRRAAMAMAMALSTVIMAGAPVFAQESAPPRSAPAQTSAPQAPAGPTLQLSMDQAVAMALETNLGLKRNRIDLSLAAQGIAAAQAAFKPTLTSNVTRTTSSSVTQNPFEASSSTVSRGSAQASSTWRQALPWYGGGYSVNWSGNRSTTTGFTTFNPTLGSALTLSFSQPLWQRFLIDGNRVGLETAERVRAITDLQLQQNVLQTQDQVRQAYLGLIASIESLDVAQKNQELNKEAYRNAQARIKVGAAAEIDAIQSEASVLSSEDQVIQAEARVATAEDALRSLVVDTTRPDYWQVHIVATDAIAAAPRAIDVDAAIQNALTNRLDLTVARRSLDVTRLNLRLDQNLVKPSVDFLASYSAAGTGGTQLSTTGGVTTSATTGFGSVLGDVLGGTNPSWTFGVTVGYPIGQTAARVSLARAHLSEEQQQIDLKSLELTVAAAVRDAARQVQSNFRRVASTRAALAASQKQLEAEQSKLAVGMTTTFTVLQQQQALASARIAELSARIAYNQALLLFDRVQKIR
jgi:HAE1 family hydrophobic/amphiphilic exporter-1